MLKLYHTPLSFNSRRVWMALLEKELEFELIELKLDGDQFKPEFVELNPFHHIPVLVDGDFSVFESLAILDYLEAKYPQPALLPSDPQALAKARMVEMVTVNELAPVFMQLVLEALGMEESNPEKAAKQKPQINKVLQFFEKSLGDDVYFGGQSINRADIVAGTIVYPLPMFDFPLDNYAKLSAWCNRLEELPSWKETEVSPVEVAKLIAGRKAMMQKT
ncbi:glutathione S-transferase family protein [Ancylothrix sp. C2]|uniref:glutathione S-transferase family protein n=1 Tax=Ancylothrix sp. D3o TaxID=2953691 RepID=UPI0021BB42F4|nr:glutathione S-transferase family protein [Ancylothrix sp. D3o]MCT7949820.1 glutathione S-transferase family protein [Ancylothrix sp. D3o]